MNVLQISKLEDPSIQLCKAVSSAKTLFNIVHNASLITMALAFAYHVVLIQMEIKEFLTIIGVRASNQVQVAVAQLRIVNSVE